MSSEDEHPSSQPMMKALPHVVMPDDIIVSYQTGYNGRCGLTIHDLTLPVAVKRLYQGYNPDIEGTFGRIVVQTPFGPAIVMAWRAQAKGSWMPLWYGTNQCFELLARYAPIEDVVILQAQSEGKFANLEEYFQ